ncbi:hypothetical protein CEXT_156071 [Caerostris extrusa]|uniref:Uncharacterized protein n=1 Tax=Caerostris extrusa TaxID=172846 RepID=A0AAV4QCS1_CAEEX|nr:hypothetical protein CEXT_156071 [Caerostris extrusa]
MRFWHNGESLPFGQRREAAIFSWKLLFWGSAPEYSVSGKGQETGEFGLLRDEMGAKGCFILILISVWLTQVRVK